MNQVPKSGRARKTIGKTLIYGGVTLYFLLRILEDKGSDELAAWLIVPMFVMIFGGMYLYWRGRQYAARETAQQIFTDDKPDVLYLRAFRSDPSMWGTMFGVFGGQSGMVTDEEQLADVLRPVGDMVAIGRPGEDLPTPGAARLYVANDKWKDVVDQQMRAARLVVIRAGIGENLLWELNHAVNTVEPRKLLIQFLRMRKKHYEAFRSASAQIFGAPLPEISRVRRIWRVSGFMGFEGDYRRPRFYAMRAPYFRRSVVSAQRPLYQYALQPVIESFGLPWQKPPLSMMTISAISLLALGILVASVAIFYQ